MLEQINAVKEKGFKPILYVDDSLARNNEMIDIIKHARRINLPIFYENDTTDLGKLYKVHVFRYGQIPTTTEAMIKRKGGVIVSGNLVIV